MKIDIKTQTGQYVCTITSRSAREYELTDADGNRVGYCVKNEENKWLELYWDDSPDAFAYVTRGLSDKPSISIWSYGPPKQDGSDGSRIEMSVNANRVGDTNLLEFLYGYNPITEKAPGIPRGWSPIASVLAGIVLVGIIALLGKFACSCKMEKSSHQYPDPSVTRQPSETDALADDDFIVDGVFYIRSAADGKYISGMGDKNNGKGVFGHYIAMVSDKDNAVRFTPVSVDGTVCRLVTYDLPDGGEFYLDAFDSSDEACGVDLWGRGTDRDQQWIVEKQKNGTYCIYLASDKTRCLTNLTPDDWSPDDELNLVGKNADISDYQEWYIVPADTAGFEPRPKATRDPSTPFPDETDEYATDDFVVDGMFYLKAVSDDSYIGIGGEKNNSSGKTGRYIELVYYKSEAALFTPVSVEGSVCRLVTYDIDGVPFYLDAYNSKAKNSGADLWGQGNDRDQRWILERQGSAGYRIYLDSNKSLCLTNLPSEDSNHDDIVSVMESAPEFRNFQEWYLVIAD